MATFSPVDTRLRVLPQAVQSGWATGLQNMAEQVSGALMQRRAERLRAEELAAAREHESGLQAAREQAAMERLRAQLTHDTQMTQTRFGHRLEELGRTFGHDERMFGLRAEHERGLQDDAQAHSVDMFDRESERIYNLDSLRRNFERVENALNRIDARRAQDLNYDIQMRRLGVDAITAGARAQESLARMRAADASAAGAGRGSPLAVKDALGFVTGDMGLAYDDPDEFQRQLNAADRTIRFFGGPGSMVDRRLLAPQGEDATDVAPQGQPQGQPQGLEGLDLSDLDFSNMTAEDIFDEARGFVQNREEAAALARMISDPQLSDAVLRRFQDYFRGGRRRPGGGAM